MVFAVQCPDPKCRKFMLVEDSDLNKEVQCLICKTRIKVLAPPKGSPPAQPAPAPSPQRR